MNQPQRIGTDLGEKKVLSDVNEYGWQFFVWPGRSGHITPSVASRPSPVIHDWSFDRFDEITDLVEKASDLTLARHRRVRRASPTRLPDSVRWPFRGPRNAHG
jgi:hypothetical protein